MLAKDKDGGHSGACEKSCFFGVMARGGHERFFALAACRAAVPL